jgi:hypothetical protein
MERSLMATARLKRNDCAALLNSLFSFSIALEQESHGELAS